MSSIKVMSKQPPGGRCSLYMRYADVLRRRLGGEIEVLYCGETDAVPPPALLIGDRQVAPSDGVILSPEDIAASFRDRFAEPETTELTHALQAAQDQWMEEWADG